MASDTRDGELGPATASQSETALPSKNPPEKKINGATPSSASLTASSDSSKTLDHGAVVNSGEKELDSVAGADGVVEGGAQAPGSGPVAQVEGISPKRLRIIVCALCVSAFA